MTPAWTWKYRRTARVLAFVIAVTGGVAVVLIVDVFVDWLANR